MSFINWGSLFGGNAVDPITAVGNVLDNLLTSDEEKAKLDYVKTKLLQHPMIVQSEINKVQASHRSIFVAGPRPFIMWVCGFGLLYAFIVDPVLQWALPDRVGPSLPLEHLSLIHI